MNQNEPINNKVIVQLLEKLGNINPTQVQIELAESLILRNAVEYRILFHQKLSPRESTCLLLAAKGKTVQETARLMAVKISTVRTWRNKILSKLYCRSMAQAIFKGIYYGYLCPSRV